MKNCLKIWPRIPAVLFIFAFMANGCYTEIHYRLAGTSLRSNDHLFIFKVYKVIGSPDSILTTDGKFNKKVLADDYLLVTPDTSMATDGNKKFSLIHGQKGYECFRCNSKDTVLLASPAEFINAPNVYLIANLQKRKTEHRTLILFTLKENGKFSSPKYITD